jgi:hypothetical protein
MEAPVKLGQTLGPSNDTVAREPSLLSPKI